MFTHNITKEGVVTQLIVFAKEHQIRINVNHVKYLEENSQKKCNKYLDRVSTNTNGAVTQIVDYHTFMIAQTKKKPKSFPEHMKPLVVTKWVKNQYYLVNPSDSRNPLWL